MLKAAQGGKMPRIACGKVLQVACAQLLTLKEQVRASIIIPTHHSFSRNINLGGSHRARVGIDGWGEEVLGTEDGEAPEGEGSVPHPHQKGPRLGGTGLAATALPAS